MTVDRIPIITVRDRLQGLAGILTSIDTYTCKVAGTIDSSGPNDHEANNAKVMLKIIRNTLGLCIKQVSKDAELTANFLSSGGSADFLSRSLQEAKEEPAVEPETDPEAVPEPSDNSFLDEKGGE